VSCLARRVGAGARTQEVAAAAGVSRATAYRYFPNQRALFVAAHPEVDASDLLGDDAPEDPQQRLDEPELRTMLRLSLEPGSAGDLPLRQGRAISWIGEALAPMRSSLRPSVLRRLVLAIRSACGIEALVWLTDVAGLSRRQASELMRWSALALLRAALAEADEHERSARAGPASAPQEPRVTRGGSRGPHTGDRSGPTRPQSLSSPAALLPSRESGSGCPDHEALMWKRRGSDEPQQSAAARCGPALA
jgi:AcrR family transcriptional regulator